MNQKYVERLFFDQMKKITQESLEDSFGLQFSDAWIDAGLSQDEYEKELCSMRVA
ncbi:MAG: hypothetical protein ACOCZV_02045 [Nanoarchaeota archaeon]